MSANNQIKQTRASVTHNQTNTRSQEPDSMEAFFQDELLDDDIDQQNEHPTPEHSNDLPVEEEEMTIVDPLIDKASREADDSSAEDDLDESEFDDDMPLDQLDEFMSEDPEKADDLLVLDDASMGGDDDLEPLLDEEFEKVPLTASQQALEARRAIEERAERRRMDRDLNYLDFELDD